MKGVLEKSTGLPHLGKALCGAGPGKLKPNLEAAWMEQVKNEFHILLSQAQSLCSFCS